jgi:D-amino peptidase
LQELAQGGQAPLRKDPEAVHGRLCRSGKRVGRRTWHDAGTARFYFSSFEWIRRVIAVMRVFIVSDMEGVAGITKWDQVNGGKSLYEEGRVLYTEEINAAVRGARAAGATEIVVMDCHGAGGDWSFNSLIPERLDPGCEFVVQREWTEYTDFLEQGCDAALFVGMHAKAGTRDGLLSHTVSSSQWTNLSFNGVSVGESGINAALCGQWGCPVLLVTGDQAVSREARALLGEGLTTVAVKTSLGRYSARHVPPVRARQMIEEGAAAALADLNAVAPYVPSSPVEITVEFVTPDHLEKYRFLPGVEIVDSRTIVSRAADWWAAWRQFYFVG